MTQKEDADQLIRQRIRALRQNKGWSLQALASKAGLGVSTLSRIETGERRIALDQIVPLAKALGTTLDELVETGGQEVIIRPEPKGRDGMTIWALSEEGAINGVSVTKIRYEQTAMLPEPAVHPGKEWFTVLSGEVELKLGEKTYRIAAGQAAQFDTMTPHQIRPVGDSASVLSIMDHAGTEAHQHPGV